MDTKPEWRRVKLRDYVDILTGFPFESKHFSDSKGIRLVRGDNISVGCLDWSHSKRWPNFEESLNKFLLKENDVLIGMDGSKVGHNRAVVRREDLPLLLVQRVACLRAREGLLQDYLYFLVFSDRFTKYVDSIKTGSAVPHISAEQIADYEIYLPPIDEQEEISHILTKLTQKVEMNRELVSTLEVIGRIAFKHWFVSFEPFQDKLAYDKDLGKEIPKDWEVRPVSEYCECYRGMSYQTEYLDKGNGVLLTLSVLKADGGVNYEEIRKYDEKQIKERYRIDPGDLLVGMTDLTSGEKMLGAPLIVPDIVNTSGVKASCVHHFCILKRKRGSYLNNAYFYFMFKQNNFRKLMNMVASGTTVRQIASDKVAEFLFPVPPVEIANHFQIIFDVVLRLIEISNFESQILLKTRDILLSKLLSGKTRVSEERFARESKALEEIGEEKLRIQKSLGEWANHA